MRTGTSTSKSRCLPTATSRCLPTATSRCLPTAVVLGVLVVLVTLVAQPAAAQRLRTRERPSGESQARYGAYGPRVRLLGYQPRMEPESSAPQTTPAESVLAAKLPGVAQVAPDLPTGTAAATPVARPRRQLARHTPSTQTAAADQRKQERQQPAGGHWYATVSARVDRQGATNEWTVTDPAGQSLAVERLGTHGEQARFPCDGIGRYTVASSCTFTVGEPLEYATVQAVSATDVLEILLPGVGRYLHGPKLWHHDGRETPLDSRQPDQYQPAKVEWR